MGEDWQRKVVDIETKMPTQFVLQGFYFQLAWTKFWSIFGLISFEKNPFHALWRYSILWTKAWKVETVLKKSNTFLICSAILGEKKQCTESRGQHVLVSSEDNGEVAQLTFNCICYHFSTHNLSFNLEIQNRKRELKINGVLGVKILVS